MAIDLRVGVGGVNAPTKRTESGALVTRGSRSYGRLEICFNDGTAYHSQTSYVAHSCTSLIFQMRRLGGRLYLPGPI
jgi:hypothetical protein